MSPRNSDRFRRESFWPERWFPDLETAKLVALQNEGNLSEFTCPQPCKIDTFILFERPSTNPVRASQVAVGLESIGGWLFQCATGKSLDLLHSEEIVFVAQYAAKFLDLPTIVRTKMDIHENWGDLADVVGGFIDSTISVNADGTETSERPHIGCTWGEPQSIDSFFAKLISHRAKWQQEELERSKVPLNELEKQELNEIVEDMNRIGDEAKRGSSAIS